MVLLYAFIQPSFFGVIAGDRGEKKKEVDIQSSKKRKEVNHKEKNGKVKSTDKKKEKILTGKKIS